MSSRTRIPRQLRTRGFTVASTLIVLAVAVQLTVIIVASTVASREVDAAAADTYDYVGDLTVESVGRYADSGRDLVDDTALFLRHTDVEDRSDLIGSMSERLARTPNVRTLYVGWANGDFLAVTREDEGFVSQWIEHSAGTEVRTQFGEELVPGEETTQPSDYDPRTRPWYEPAANADGGVWSPPYLDYGNPITLVTPAAAVRIDGTLVGVVGADLDLPALRSILDDLPYGEGAEAFVLSPSHEVIGAPEHYTDRIEELAEELGRVPTAAELGIPVTVESLEPGEAVFTNQDELLLLDRALPDSESVDWRVHISAEASQLSAGLGRVGVALWWVLGLSAVVSAIAITFAWSVSHSVRRMRVRASTDQLTGLANRHQYETEGKDMLLQAAVRGEQVLAVVLDLDHFKALNDKLGHDVGDAVLAATGEALHASVRGEDVAARLGGDEFVVLQKLVAREDPHAIVERIRENVEVNLEWVPMEGSSVGVTAGYALSEPGMDLKDLVALADAALVEGKRSAKGMAHRG